MTSELIRRRNKPMTEADFIRETELHLAQLRALEMFIDLGEHSAAERISKAENDFNYFCETYFPHICSDEPADWHPEFDADLNETDSMLAITAMRGGGKSTRIMLRVLHWIAYRGIKYCVYSLSSDSLAEYYTDRIRIELVYNERFRNDFGAMVDPNAAKGDFQCFDPKTHQSTTRIKSHGFGMSFRGLVSGHNRPDVIIFEDVQDRDAAESEVRTAKAIRIVLNDARNALVPMHWRFIVAGNVVCTGSMVDEFLNPEKHKGFRKRRYPAEEINEAGERVSTWPSRFPLHILDAAKEDIGEIAYEEEYLCNAVELGRIFKEKRDLHQYANLPEELDLENAEIIEQIDQAESGFSDYTAIGMCVAYEHNPSRKDYGKWADKRGKALGEGNYLLFLEIFCQQVGIDETIDEAVEMFDRHKASVMHWDGSVDKELIWERFIANYETRMGRTLPVVFDKFLVKKELRIKSVQPLMGRRRVLFPPHDNENWLAMRKQFLRFGTTNVNDDGPDMVAAAADNASPEYQIKTEVYTI